MLEILLFRPFRARDNNATDPALRSAPGYDIPRPWRSEGNAVGIH